MLNSAEKPEFLNTREVRVCEKVMPVSFQMHEEPCILTGFQGKPDMEWIILDPLMGFWVELLIWLGEIMFLKPINGKCRIKLG